MSKKALISLSLLPIVFTCVPASANDSSGDPKSYYDGLRFYNRDLKKIGRVQETYKDYVLVKYEEDGEIRMEMKDRTEARKKGLQNGTICKETSRKTHALVDGEVQGKNDVIKITHICEGGLILAHKTIAINSDDIGKQVSSVLSPNRISLHQSEIKAWEVSLAGVVAGEKLWNETAIEQAKKDFSKYASWDESVETPKVAAVFSNGQTLLLTGLISAMGFDTRYSYQLTTTSSLINPDSNELLTSTTKKALKVVYTPAVDSFVNTQKALEKDIAASKARR